MDTSEVPPRTLPELIRPLPLSNREESEITTRYRMNLDNAKKILDSNLQSKKVPSDTMESFQILGKLGAGGYATVYLVQRHQVPDKTFALKVQAKVDASVTTVMQEKQLLYSLQSSFVVKLLCAFKDVKNLYMLLEHAAAGDLSRFMKFRFSEDVVKFLAVQMVLAIEYLHACQLVHRDVKLNNFLVFADNYIKIADFGFCEHCEEKNFDATGTSATPYQAPETFGFSGYGRSIDWWAFGVMLFELKYKKHPYCRTRMNATQTAFACLHHALRFPHPAPSEKAPVLVNWLIKGLLEKDPTKRLGSKGIRAHPWFSDISFNDILLKRVKLSVDFRDLKPLTPEQLEEYDFLPGPGDVDPCPRLFKDF